MAKLHPKVQELKNSVGHMPIHSFYPSRKTKNEYLEKTSPKRKSNDSDEIEQYFCIWGVSDDYGTEPMPGCFNKSIEERGPNSKAPGKIIVLDQHRQMMPVCLPSEIKEDTIGLYGRYTPDPIARNKDLIIQIQRGTINNGSYGFQYVWDKMQYDDKTDTIKMFECGLEEISPVTFGSQRDTFVIRSNTGFAYDEQLIADTEEIIKQIPRKFQLEIRGLIARHISLANTQPSKNNRNSLRKNKPKQRSAVDLDYLIDNIQL